MEKVKVQKSELIAVLKKNRDIHEKDYSDAVCGYRLLVEKELKKRLKLVQSGEKFDLYFNLNRPESHVKDYDDVIGMLEISSDEEVDVKMEEYLKYYKNEWNWQEGWKSTYSGYAAFYNSPGGTKPKMG